MKYISSALITLLLVSSVIAQEGVHFQHGLSWKEVVALATKENKYIMVDCYTTWCGPCKLMTTQIFPQKAAGDFFNAGFISTKLQLDKTNKDLADIRAQYADAAMFEKDYKIFVYPTFLFFTPKGELVHRSVGSGTVEEIINEGKNATNPNKAFYTLQKEYNTGKISNANLFTLASEALDIRDPEAAVLAKAYIKTQKNMFTKENVALLSASVQSAQDTGYTIIAANQNLYDKATEKGAAQKLLTGIQAPDNSPATKTNEVPKNGNNWGDIKKDLTTNIHLSPRVLLLVKANYYQAMSNGDELAKAATEYFNTYPDSCTADLLNKWAHTIFLHCSNNELLKTALPLSKASVERSQQPENMDTYACLLYRTGKVEAAIEWETKARNLAKTNKDQYDATIAKMKSSEKIW